jgi:hypothetical protein
MLSQQEITMSQGISPRPAMCHNDKEPHRTQGNDQQRATWTRDSKTGPHSGMGTDSYDISPGKRLFVLPPSPSGSAHFNRLEPHMP